MDKAGPAQQYNKVCDKILRVTRRDDACVMKQHMQKAWNTFGNRVRNSICVEVRAMASEGFGMGYEELNVHRLYTKIAVPRPLCGAG